MTNQSLKRGAIPSPRHVLAAATPYLPRFSAPINFIRVPNRISWWGNDVYNDCVTTEEAFAKACENPEIFISDSDVIAWATQHDVLDGAYITQVMQWMQKDGFPKCPYIYDDGPYSAVNWMDASALQNAISEGPVKIGIAAAQIDTVWHTTNGQTGWFALGLCSDAPEDHCVSLCGYGTLSWLAQQLHVDVPANIDGSRPGYAMFTWNSIGIIDEQSLIAITGEAWLRQPTTVRKCCAVGPSGGTGGDCCIDDPIPEGAQIKMIRVHHSDRIDAIGISYEVNGETVDLMHGGTGGTEDKFVLNPDEYVMGVYWCFGNIIDSITIVTNQRESPLYGGPGGNAHYCYVLGSDMEIVGFLGRAKKAIDAIGCVFRARPA